MTYDRELYNCSHFVADYYAAMGVSLPSGAPSAWGYRFIRWMRQHFHAVPAPVQNCLILIKYRGHDSYHVGVYDRGMMVHNHHIGQIIRTPLVLMRSGADLTYWALNDNN